MQPRSDSQPQLAGVVLAGGRSSRMGVDKASLVIDGRTMLQRTVDALEGVVDEIVVVLAPGQAQDEVQSSHPVRFVEDPVEGEGPLVGIAAGLGAAQAPVALVVGCDMPYLRPALLRLIAERASAGSRLVVPLHAGRPEPLCSAWRTNAVTVIHAHIEAGDRAIMAVASDLDAQRVPPEDYAAADPDGRSFINLNTPEEFRAVLADD